MTRTSPLAPYRWVLLGVVVLLAVVAFLFLRGPGFWQRRYYPLEHREALRAASDKHHVNPYLIAAVINAESGWDASTRSHVGAVGLMQVMPRTARDLARKHIVNAEKYPPSELSDPSVNIEYGTAYLRVLIGRYHEKEAALAAYNAGLANADRWVAQGGNIRNAIDFPQTRHFVLQVSRGKDRYEALYPHAFEGWSGK